MLQDIGKKIDQNTPNVDLKSNPKDLAQKAADKASNAVSDLSAVFDLAESPTNIGANIRVSWLGGALGASVLCCGPEQHAGPPRGRVFVYWFAPCSRPSLQSLTQKSKAQ